MIKLSIITINFNNCEGLKITMQSVINQNFKNYEYIVIDGGSTDDSLALVKSYSTHLSYWCSEKDRGIYHAMNKGINAAKGEYLLFLNSGDFLVDDDVLNSVFSTTHNHDILYGNLKFLMDENTSQVKVQPPNLSLNYLFHGNLWHPATFIKRTAIHQYDESFRVAADYDFFFSYFSKYPHQFKYINITVSSYNFEGISSRPENIHLINYERNKAHQKVLTQSAIELLNIKQRFKVRILSEILSRNPILLGIFESAYDIAYQLIKFPKSHHYNNKVVFWTPTFWKTGSELVLFRLMKGLKIKLDYRVNSRYKGKLGAEFYPYHYINLRLNKDFFGRIINYANYKIWFKLQTKRNRNAVWYINTTSWNDLILRAQQLNTKVILHVHELPHMFNHLNKLDKHTMINYPALVIANSNASAEYFINNGRKGKIEIIYPKLKENPFTPYLKNRTAIRANNNLSELDFLWVMCGTVDHNKQPKLFIEIANQTIQKYKRAKFLWLGDISDENLYQECLNLINKNKLSDKVQFYQGDLLYEKFSIMDGFLLTSNFESFSMVTAEAMYLNKPIVANNCIGVNEVLGSDIGTIVNNKNSVDEISNALIGYMEGSHKVNEQLMATQLKKFNSDTIQNVWEKNILNCLN